MSELIEAIINGTCPDCNTELPDLEREGSGWPTVDCPKCGEWYNVYKYKKAGGKEI